MATVEYFKSTKKTHRFNKNQKVWVSDRYANHMEVHFKWRGKGRYVHGIADNFAAYVGEIKSIEVDDDFAARITAP